MAALVAAALSAALWRSVAAFDTLPVEVIHDEIGAFLGGDVGRLVVAGGVAGWPDGPRGLYEADCRPAGIGQLSPDCVSRAGFPVRYYRAGPRGRSVCCYAHLDSSAAAQAAFDAAVAGDAVGRLGLLLQDPRPLLRADPAADDNEALQAAAGDGHAAVVRLLLDDPRVDPAARDNEALRLSARRGHAVVVQLLLDDRRVDPAALDNQALREAAAGGHAAVVRLLLSDRRVDPAALDNQALRRAAAQRHAAVVRLLLGNPRVDPAALDNQALRWAAAEGLLDDPAALDNQAL